MCRHETPDVIDQNYRQPPNDRRCELLLISIWNAIDACRTLLAGHDEEALKDGEECDCDHCDDARGLLYNLGHSEACFSCTMLLNFPEAREHMRMEARRRGNKRAEEYWSIGPEPGAAPDAGTPPEAVGEVAALAIAQPVSALPKPSAVNPFYGKVAG